ncbi:class I SAM-dependent methyltransferase [Thermodesulfobacteriota bacterium]
MDYSGNKIKKDTVNNKKPFRRVHVGFDLPIELPDIDYFLKCYTKSIPSHNFQSNESIRKKYGTRLDKNFFRHFERIVLENPEPRVLDLGCGTGGSKKYLNSLGISDVTSLDISSRHADILADAHCLPFRNLSFDVILSTATIEHFYNPFIAFKEMNRVLRHGGRLLASASFWERWHDNSCFHCTPHGLYILCTHSGFEIIDIWSGWGFFASVFSHAISKRLKKLGLVLQFLFDSALRVVRGEDAVKKHRLRTSGSFGVCAMKQRPIEGVD